LPFPICHQLLSGQLDQCARLSFPCSLYWIQSLQLIFLSTKLNTCVCICVSCSDEFDYIALSNFGFKELRYQLHSIFDRNLSTVRGWTFAKFLKNQEEKKNVKCRCIEEKESKCFVRKKKSKCPKKKFFKVWRGGGEYLSMEFRVFEKKN